MNTAEALDRLILFRQKPDSLLRRLMSSEEAVRVAAQGELVALAVENGWQGDLWRCCIAWTLTEHENPFSLSWERRTGPEDTLSALALADMAVFHALLSAPPEEGPWHLLRNFHHESRQGKESAPLTELAAALAELAAALADAASPAALLDCLTAFYQSHGVGQLGLGQVFRVRREADGVRLLPVRDRPPVRLADLVGYRQQKEQLVRNTEAFLHGRGGNNVLLYGDAGTGKSTSVQAIANEYAAKGLRLIEVYKEQYDLIPALLRQIKGRNYRFLLFLDDLSFEENETSYKYLKAVMEGGAEAPPENVRICATSNRRHLVREVWSDRSDIEHDGDIHRSDTVEEKLSLASRFGLQIFYPAPTFEEYQQIVSALSEKAGTDLSPEQLRAAAATWQVRSGSRSGRTAQQFVNQLDR